MGSREDPALMMDPANCSPVQVAGTCQKDPPSHCLSGWQLYITTQRPNGGESYTCSRDGVADLAACLPYSLQLGCEGLDWRPALKLPGVQQPLPEVHMSRAWHRCSAPAWRGGERHINAYRVVLRLFAWFWSRRSGQVRRSPHLMEADGFPGACHSQIISSDRKSVWFG